MLAGMSGKESSNQVEDLARQADDLARRQQAFEGQMRKSFGQDSPGLTREQDGHWRRVVIEKPFGRDLASAQQLDRELRRVLKTGIGEIPIAVSETFRGQIKRLELESEQIEQHLLEGCEPASLGVSALSRERIAEANLTAYGDHLGGFPAQALTTILAAFGEFGRHHPAGIA